MEEEWRPVRDYEGIYEVSDHGRLVRTSTKSNSHDHRVHGEQKLVYSTYIRAVLNLNGHQKAFLVHRLVYEAFNGPIPKGLEINHKNGDKHDNRLENLEAVTRLENTRHAYAYLDKASTAARGIKAGKHKLDEESVRAMRELRRNGMTFKDIAKRFGVVHSAAHNAISGRSWRHVT